MLKRENDAVKGTIQLSQLFSGTSLENWWQTVRLRAMPV